ncbi:Flagellin-like protein [Hyphomicrobiales bacterium]|nr:Flagellin-like protein [Hyphomicrobiales bacterium]CAH1700133.1 Flagellin-like protein [Hyphomicrobiales bacterium]CAI0343895.1 Flagellin-like protein [Hyphomicrobiales bacterium]
MTITAYGTGAYRTAKPNEFVSTRSQFDDLQRQLVTKKRSTSYGDLGIDRRVSLDLNAKISSIDSWLSGIQLSDVNIKLASQAVENFAKLTGESRQDTLSSSYVATAGGRSGPQVLAEEKFKQTLDQLNISVNGRYLFSGQTSDVRPTASFDEIINGDGAGKAGLKQLIDERRQADLGDGLGRLTTGMSGATTVTVADGNHLYGFKIDSATASTSALAVTVNSGTPADIAVDVAAQPQPGDTLRIRLDLPDGTQEEVVLTARAAGSGGMNADSFEIGATAADTATQLKAAIDAALGREARTTLSAASSQVAARDFFSGSPNNPPPRVPGPPFATVTAPPTKVGASNTTVIWYRGDDGIPPLASNDPALDTRTISPFPSARDTANVQVDQGQLVGVGARANEQAFQTGLAQFAIMTVETYPAGDADSQDRYLAMTARVSSKLGTSTGTQQPAEILVDFGSAQTALANAKERHEDTKSYLASALSSVEDVTPEEVAAQIMSLQTQLQASYQVTSMLSKLSLTNFL